MAVVLNNSQAGPRLTINEFLKDPLLVREVVLNMANQGFIADAVLRFAGRTQSGTALYRESSPLYANTDAQTRAEFAEVPLAETSEGEPRVLMVEERALGVAVSDEMVRRNSMDVMQRQLMRVRNTMFRSWDRTFFKAIFEHPSVQHYAVTTAWADPDSNPRLDIVEGIRLVEEASADGTIDSEFDFEADTLIIGRGSKSDLFGNEKFNKLYENSPLVSEHLLYTGKLPKRMLDLDVMVSSRVPAGKAVVMQRNIAGFIMDEVPLTVSPMYRVEEKKFSRADVQRASGVGLDQPKAIAVLDGV